MSELLLELDVGFIVIAVGGCVVDAWSSVFVVDDDPTIFIAAILQLLYKEEVHVAPDIAYGGGRQCDTLGEGVRNWGSTMSMG